DAVLEAHQLGQHFRALNNRNVELVSFGDLRIVRGDGGTGDDDFGVRSVFGAVALKSDRAEAGEPLSDCGRLQVRARNLVAKVQQNAGDAAHADAADAYEMDALDLGEHSEPVISG